MRMRKGNWMDTGYTLYQIEISIYIHKTRTYFVCCYVIHFCDYFQRTENTEHRTRTIEANGKLLRVLRRNIQSYRTAANRRTLLSLHCPIYFIFSILHTFTITLTQFKRTERENQSKKTGAATQYTGKYGERNTEFSRPLLSLLHFYLPSSFHSNTWPQQQLKTQCSKGSRLKISESRIKTKFEAGLKIENFYTLLKKCLTTNPIHRHPLIQVKIIIFYYIIIFVTVLHCVYLYFIIIFNVCALCVVYFVDSCSSFGYPLLVWPDDIFPFPGWR